MDRISPFVYGKETGGDLEGRLRLFFHPTIGGEIYDGSTQAIAMAYSNAIVDEIWTSSTELQGESPDYGFFEPRFEETIIWRFSL